MSEQNYKVFWDEALNQIHEEYKNNGKETEFNLWFNMTYENDNSSEIIVSVPSEFMWNRMNTMGYINLLQNKIEELCGQKITLSYILNKDTKDTIKELSQSSTEQNTNVSAQNSLSALSAGSTVSIDNSYKNTESSFQKKNSFLNEDFTFEKFVNGENTEFAYSAALAAAQNPGKTYSPLLIYGGVGLGKTHLMQAIGNFIYDNAVKNNKPVPKIVYISAENFTNEFTKSLRDKTTEKFKSKYRNLDVLLLDDIHFLINKDSTQEELFYTFEALLSKHAQMVFTCDRPISEFKNNIEERLKSRFKMGTSIDIRSPTYETRLAILLKKLEILQKDIPYEVVDFIATNIQTNVRELQGCLIKMINYASLLNKPLTLEIAQNELKDEISRDVSTGTITIDVIQKVVANYFKISISEIKSDKRKKNIVFPRHIAIYIARELGDYAYTTLGEEFGGKDHSTMMNSVEKIKEQLKTDSSLKATIDSLIKEIKEYKRN